MYVSAFFTSHVPSTKASITQATTVIIDHPLTTVILCLYSFIRKQVT